MAIFSLLTFQFLNYPISQNDELFKIFKKLKIKILITLNIFNNLQVASRRSSERDLADIEQPGDDVMKPLFIIAVEGAKKLEGVWALTSFDSLRPLL